MLCTILRGYTFKKTNALSKRQLRIFVRLCCPWKVQVLSLFEFYLRDLKANLSYCFLFPLLFVLNPRSRCQGEV